MYNTKQLTKEYRRPQTHGARFNICEHCGYDSTVKGSPYNVTYYHHFGLVLCDRCIDKSNYPNDNYWQDADALRAGFPVFPYPEPKVIETNKQELETYRKEKRFKYYED